MIFHKKHLSFIKQFKPGLYAKFCNWNFYGKIVKVEKISKRFDGDVEFSVRLILMDKYNKEKILHVYTNIPLDYLVREENDIT